MQFELALVLAVTAMSWLVVRLVRWSVGHAASVPARRPASATRHRSAFVDALSSGDEGEGDAIPTAAAAAALRVREVEHARHHDLCAHGDRTHQGDCVDGHKRPIPRDYSRLLMSLGGVETEVLHFAAADLSSAITTATAAAATTTAQKPSSRAASSRKQHSKTIAVMIPGNPGVAEFYLPYMRHLWTASEHSVDVVAISHAGHSIASANNGRLFSLEEQIAHKVDFVRALLRNGGVNNLDKSNSEPDNVQLVLMGHSVGAHICLKVLQRLSAQERTRVSLTTLLFPTIQYIGKTPNAARIGPLTKIRPVLAHIVGLVDIFVHSAIRQTLVRMFMGHGEEVEILHAVRNLICRSTISNVLYMAAHEFEEIGDWDSRVIQANLDKLVFYYGRTDGWVPLSHFDRTRETFPAARAILCERQLKHAFVLEGGSEQMAELVYDWIRSSNGASSKKWQ
ncbi:hypothetical protein CAOG_03794 [Capsaspora owczarzaki ATCC 30864]|uniref:Lipid droplet-associated serine hydrolase n=1 Tax=Capsaspora owczarzaki (strain ATCC 30864) TaxID=595528 RepID=A0A0D2VQH0_CAPO3|nr:hypothetical protein CAOG_03794 [Capsaspora owczarzaki ATCC 30864]KJE92912.1 hypothetical protein CAOG_003794 [Capsaspora owczarzaki ATCC 30864]|eukprot:XP_004363522.1 hypothetical protein CAOG_03794 [Capsaspora owczarzaki ATCC 30864]